MRLRIGSLLLAAMVVTVAVSGCTSSRDIDNEAADRAAYAKKHNDYQPIAVLSGPETIAPGALVWFSAYGSHDPDFFGASTRDLRDEARSEGGVHIHNDYEHQEFSWYVTLDSEADDSLGTGIKEYHWRIDGGAPRIAHELTHRYGSEDGPLRFPVGFTEPGTHVITLTVVDWSGARDTVSTKVRVEEGGIDSMLTDWSVTEEGWTYTRNVPVSWMKYGDCQPVRSDYDASVHHVNAPWDLIFFMKDVTVRATWEEVAAPSPLDPLRTNLNDVDLTLGHCESPNEGQDVWATFATDTEPFAEPDELVEEGDVTGDDFAAHLEMTGARTERMGEWDFNAYLSNEGNGQWGFGSDVTVAFVFHPATDTSYGGL